MASPLRRAWDFVLEPRAERNYSPVSWNQWLSYFTFAGNQYPLLPSQTIISKQEAPPATFSGFSGFSFQANAVVYACMSVRMLLFSEARFQFRRLQSGRPGELFGTSDLAVLEQPWPNGTTGDLLTRMIQDVDLAGNFYGYRRGQTIKRLRPDWVTIVLGSQMEPDSPGIAADAEVVGYVYAPPEARRPLTFLPEEICHFAPIPDPLARFRGMSWLSPLVREVMADSAATQHKLSFFENGATPNMVVSLDPNIQQRQFDDWIAAFRSQHEGIANAYRTLYLGGGAKVEVVGANMQQIDFKTTQGAGETRIAAAAGVPPVLVGLSEGLASATYSNYGQARRRFADGTMRPLWRNAAASLAALISIPPGAELWYDDRDIPFLREDLTDEAQIHQTQALTIRQLVDAGFDPPSVVQAVMAGNFSLLKHTGLYSVQLQPPMPEIPNPEDVQPVLNGAPAA